METSNASILIVEDDPEHIRLYSKLLRRHRTKCVSRASEALTSIQDEIPDLIILDNVLDGGERGIEFLRLFKRDAAHVPVILISGTLAIRDQLQALQGPLSAHYVLEKPLRVEEFEGAVDKALNECGLGETVALLKSLDRSEKTESFEADRRQTERLGRQHQLLNHFRGGTQPINVSAMARKYGVSRRTIRRDILELVARGQLDTAQAAAADDAGLSEGIQT